MNHRHAFTLVELLVVVAIIAFLMGLLLPSLALAREVSRATACLSNIRQMLLAATVYNAEHDGYYPTAYDSTGLFETPARSVLWDYIITTDWSGSPPIVTHQPGLLWMSDAPTAIQQCPTFTGNPNFAIGGQSDPHTGYNYNTSYIGRGTGESNATPARTTEIRQPTRTLIFGDGEYADGANKFMRSPLASDSDGGFFARHTGTQGYRHAGSTVTAWGDGHAKRWDERHSLIESAGPVAPNTGFVSADNSLYDLE